jgi:nucleoside-diphosphate-sugar epimerase
VRVLLTGAFGVIGVATIAALRDRGHRVRCFDRPGRGARRIARELGDGVEVVWGDVRDATAVRAAVAIATSLTCPAARGRVLLIGGGPRCRIRQHELLGAITDGLGLAPLPAAAFGDADFYTDWMDTAESERLLRFQGHSFEDFRAGMAHYLRWYRWLSWPVRPLVRRALLQLSGPWKRRDAAVSKEAHARRP